MNSISRSVLFLAVSLFALGAQAQPFNCKTQAAKLSTESGKAVRCFCGADLDNVSVTLPKGLKVAGVCGLADPRGVPIDLESQKVSLDVGVKKAYPNGTIYLSGAIALEGVVTTNPSEAGDMWFESKPLVSTSEFVTKHLASNIRLGEDDYRAFKAPKQELLTPMCFKAPASITANDLEVTLTPKGKSSAVARRIDVRKVARFLKCDPNSQRLVAP
ncbi:MAG: hypothetical protein V4723_05230 [Pseudomonadota bacterium]